MIELTKDTFKSEVEEHDGLVVIDLYADWCGPCKMLAPIVKEIEGEMPEVKFAKINVDREPELTKAFRVTSIPVIALVRDNTLIDMSVGYTTKEKLVEFISEYK